MNKILLFLFFAILSTNSFSQIKAKPYEKVSIDGFITETQFGSDATDQMELIWWMPTEYWDIVFSQDPTTSKSEKEAIIELVKDYVLVLAVKGKIGIFGGVTYETEESIKSMTKVTYKNEELILLEKEEIGPDLINFLSMIQPMMKNMLGPMGENLVVLLYKNPVGNEVLPINPISEDSLIFELGEFHKNVSLPLGSLLEEKICPDDSEELNGKWNFCPMHGTKLEYKK